MEVQAERLMADVRAIASHVRVAGTAEEALAFDYIEREAEAASLAVRRITHPAYISVPGPARLRVGTSHVPVITHSFALAGRFEGTLADADREVRGRIAVAAGLASPQSVLALEERGARGAIFINQNPYTHEMALSRVWGSPAVEDLGRYPKIPVVSTAEASGKALRAAAARGESAVIEAEVETDWREIPLLIADLRADPSDDFVLFSAHVDSWHYGAMDNATANATQLEVARILAGKRRELRRGVRFAFWSGHSQGRYAGSTWYADHHWLDLYEHCVVHINIDSVGAHGATVLTQGMATPETRRVGIDVVGRRDQVFEGSFVGRSGDQSFVGIGIESLLMSLSEQPLAQSAMGAAQLLGQKTGGFGWWWHTTEDTVDKISPEYLARDAQIYLEVVRRFARDERVPLEIPAGIRDVAAQVEAHRAQLQAVDAQEELEDLVRRALDAWTALERRDLPAGTVNAARKAASRLLVRLRHTKGHGFAYDPALPLAPYPGLVWAADTPEQRIALRRGLNRIAKILTDLTAVAQNAV